MKRIAWTDFVFELLIIAIAIWMIISPWVLARPADGAGPYWSFVVAGALNIVLSLTALFFGQAWQSWGTVTLACWLISSPWILGYAPNEALRWDAVGMGIALIGLALARITTTDVGRPAGEPIQFPLV
jgi:hypothetical protein